MADHSKPAISTSDESSVAVRDTDLTTEIMGEIDFGEAFSLLLLGRATTEAEGRLMNAMLSSLMVHGLTPHALAARLTSLSEPNATQAAITSGLLGVGSRFAGAMEECAREVQEVAAADDPEAVVSTVVTAYRERGDTFPGIGHGSFDPVDPRARRLFELAEEENMTGDHQAILRQFQHEFEAATGVDLPINVTGAIAVITSDMGLPPEAARGIAVVSRAAGLTAEVIEEGESPITPEILAYSKKYRLNRGE